MTTDADRRSETGDLQYEKRLDWSQTTPSTAVPEAVAAVEGVDVLELSARFDGTLYDAVDPGALDSLFSSADNGSVVVDFTFGPYQLRIDGATLSVREPVE